MLIRAAWLISTLVLIAAGVFYVSGPTTAGWYVYSFAAMPFVALVLLRVRALQKGRDGELPINEIWKAGTGPIGPPPP